MIRYKPEISVEYDGGKISFFSHREMDYNPSIARAIALLGEWLLFWAKTWIFALSKVVFSPFQLLKKKN